MDTSPVSGRNDAKLWSNAPRSCHATFKSKEGSLIRYHIDDVAWVDSFFWVLCRPIERPE